MSRTRHHSLKYGSYPYGTGTKQRAWGYEFWSRRPRSAIGFGRELKTECHRIERRVEAKAAIREQVRDL